VANRDLYTAMMRSPRSTLLSEYPPGILADKWTFVRRNRIISGISLGTLVVKAGERSGALITARYALEQNREVFACPGHAFDSGYAGCHNLIKSGAIMVSDTGDILQEFSLSGSFENVNASEVEGGAFTGEHSSGNDGTDQEYADNSIEGRILSILSGGRRQVDSLVRLIGGTAREVNETLALLEISGLIERDGNMILRL
jgi:DNA processing protein